MSVMCTGYLCTSKIPLFAELSQNEQRQIANTAQHFDKEPYQTVVRENEKADFILIIREGKVKLNTFDTEGKEYILNIKLTSNIVGEEYLLKNTVFDYNVETIEPSKFCKISTDILFQKAMDNPQFAKKMILSLSKELQDANNKLRLIMESDALHRLSGFLLYQSKRIDKDEISLSLDDIAGITNLRKETLSRKFKQLEQKGYIKRIGQKQIKITNYTGLEKIFYES